MGTDKKLKIFKKPSIAYLKRLYKKSISNIFDKNNWISNSPEYLGESKILLHTRKSLQRLGEELNIFNFLSVPIISFFYN